MATFELHKPIQTTEPVVMVDAGLPPGAHRFRLVAVDESGRQSEPREMIVTVLDPRPPAASRGFLRRLLGAVRRGEGSRI